MDFSNTPSEDSTSTIEEYEYSDVVVIGTGFVGLPLALLLADNGKNVVGIDIDENIVEAINSQTLNLGESHLQELLEKDTVQKNLEARTNPVGGDAFVISVPTPLTNPYKSPNLSHLEDALESIIPYLKRGNLLNIESTIPPLTCKNVIIPRLEQAGLTVGDDIHVAHSPERILPGNVFEEIRTNDRIIGGATEECASHAAAIYQPFLEGDMHFSDLVTAELCKLLENTYRDINIALANEFALIGDQLDIEIGNVIELANKHPRVNILKPGIGVGGHCLPVDPWFLNEVDPEHTNLITTARRINDKMPSIAAQKIRHRLREYNNPNVLILGASYKPNVGDKRNSPAIEIVEELQADGYTIDHYDRHVDGMKYENLPSLISEKDLDIIIQLVPHELTVDELRRVEELIQKNNIELLQFTDGDLITRS